MKRLTTGGVLVKIETVLVPEFSHEQVCYRLHFNDGYLNKQERCTAIVTEEVAKELQVGQWYAFSMFYGRETTELPIDEIELDECIQHHQKMVDFSSKDTVYCAVTKDNMAKIVEHLKNYAMLCQKLWPR